MPSFLSILLEALKSLIFGFGLLIVAAVAVVGAYYALKNRSSIHEHVATYNVMRFRRVLTVFVAISIAVDMLTVTWQPTRIACLVATAIYALSVYAIIPATRWQGKVVPTTMR